MPNKVLYNIIVLAVIWGCIVAVGVYVTMFQQPDELERLDKAVKVERLKTEEVNSLFTEYSSLELQADDAYSRWRARYKIIPAQLSSPEVIGYFNSITRTGFENFDVSFSGTHAAEGYRYHSFNIGGRGYFSDLYRIIWELENNRYFYSIEGLSLSHIDIIAPDSETGNDRMKVMVSFSLTIQALFGGADGISATGEEGEAGEVSPLPVSRAKSERPPVPGQVLPDERPAINPFFPLIMSQLPPNTHGLINVETASLFSIVGDKAVFQEPDGFRSVGVGEDVYLGQITEINPLDGVVTARLNKGGIIDDVELYLQTGEQYRQALGSIRLAPVEEEE